MQARSFLRFLVVVSAIAVLVAGCSSGSSSVPPPGPQPDFSISVVPAAISVTVGTNSFPVRVSVEGQNGFVGNVSVAIAGLPSGATSSPPTPLTIPAFGNVDATFFIPPQAQSGIVPLQLNGTGGGLSHSTSLTLTVLPVSGNAVLQETTGQGPAGTIEIQGLSAGNFNPDYWQTNTLNWVPDVRMPMLAPQTTGPFQNIYAPWALEQTTGWRLFYGGDDGSDTPNDRVYSGTTGDFLTFDNRTLVIDHGAFAHVNNVNVQQLPDGSLHMICTGGDPTGLPADKPVYFSSPDGSTWNGAPEPYSAQLTDIVSIQGYTLFSSGNFNGANVLLRDNSAWVLYFTNWQNDPHTMHRATASTLPNFELQGVALKTDHAVNDVRKFTVNGASWYLMGLHNNAQALWYSLSNDGVSFGSEQTLFNHFSAQDLYMVALGFVTRGNEMLGVLYGASPVETLDQNRIFARWLQKKVVITDSSGVQYIAQVAYGPDRQWFQAPQSGPLEGTLTVFAENGSTLLGSSLVTLSAGKAYSLVLK